MSQDQLNNNQTTMELLLSRRSLVAAKMTAPGPSEAELEQILMAGIRVPDHGRAEPWRIQIVDSSGRQELARLQTEIFRLERHNDVEKKLEILNQITLNSPCLLVVTSRPVPEKFEKVPLLEQQLSGGALCQNILIAAHALGYVAQWITGWPAYHDRIKALLGHDSSADILGFIHIGSAGDALTERPRPDYNSIVSRWPN